MLALGSASETIESQIEEGLVQFDLGSSMSDMLLADLNSPAHLFLLGRCLSVGSKFSFHLQQPVIASFLEGTVRGLHHDQPHPVRILLIWGLCNHLRGLKDAEESPRRQVLEYNNDHVITSLSRDIFKVLSANPKCAAPIQGRLVPPLLSILNASEDKSGLKGLALDVLSSLVRSAPRPLSDPLMLTMFPAAIQVTLTTDDNSVLQADGECLRSYLTVAPEQVVAYSPVHVTAD